MNSHHQYKASVYTINDAAPPSYSEATGSEIPISRPYNAEFDQRYPHVVDPSSSAPYPYPNPPNYYVNSNRTIVQSTYPQYGSAEQQNRPMVVPYNNRSVTGNREFRLCSRFFQFIWVICTLAAIVGIISLIIRAF
jgi:hypothetical protein